MPAGLRLEAQVLQLWSNRGLPIAITFSKACKNSFALMFSSITLFCNVVSEKTVFLSMGNIAFKKELYYLLIKRMVI